MTDDVTVIYNGDCPICSREIAHYRARAERAGAPLAFEDLARADLSRHGLTRDGAARRIYAVENGRLLGGLDAFAAVWSRLPGLRWLARAARLPVLRPVLSFGYERIAAPALYALHRRRQRRA